MISHMRGRHSVSGGPRGFTRGDVSGLPRGGVRSNRCRASRADTDLSGRPRASRLDREAGPVVEWMAPAEQREHVLRAVSRPQGKLPMPVQIK
jgi:hypothetical protein